MNYLNEATLEIILFLLTQKEALNTSFFSRGELLSAIKDFGDNDIRKAFVYKLDNFPDGFTTTSQEFEEKYMGTTFSNIEEFLSIDHYPCSSLENCLFIMLNDKNSLNLFLDKYLKEYEKNNLTSKNNYYSFEKTMASIDSIFGSYYKNYGSRFNINQVQLLAGNKEIRFYELLLFLQGKGFVDIHTCRLSPDIPEIDFEEETRILNIDITFKKSPEEMTEVRDETEYYTEETTNVLRALRHGYSISPKNKPIRIDPLKIKGVDSHEVVAILENLEKDKKVIEIKANPFDDNVSRPNDFDAKYFLIVLKKEFNSFYINYEASWENFYEEEIERDFNNRQIGNEPVNENPPKVKSTDSCWIEYSDKARKILLNGLFLMAKPDFNSENEVVFTYLFNNQNKTISKNDLEKAIKQPLKKTFHQIINDLGFKADLGKVFFNASKDSIRFNNPITKSQLEEIGLPEIKLPIK